MPLEKKTIWVLVADGSRGRLFQVDRRERRLHLLREEESEAARRHNRDIMADRPGRSAEPGGGRHAMEYGRTPKNLEKERFVASIAGALHEDASHNRFDELYVVASPKALGELRSELTGPVRQRVKKEIDKDLTRAEEPELEKHILPEIWPV